MKTLQPNEMQIEAAKYVGLNYYKFNHKQRREYLKMRKRILAKAIVHKPKENENGEPIHEPERA